jgi:hypothetical protein
VAELLLSDFDYVHRVSDVRQVEIHTAELVPGPSTFEFDISIAKLKNIIL